MALRTDDEGLPDTLCRVEGACPTRVEAMALRRLLALAALGAAAVDLDWNDQFSASDKTLTVAASEDLTFTWTSTHNVMLMADEDAFDSCDFSGATLVGSTSPVTGSGESGTTAYYACSARGGVLSSARVV